MSYLISSRPEFITRVGPKTLKTRLFATGGTSSKGLKVARSKPTWRQRLQAYRGAVGDEYELLGHDAKHIVQQVPAKVNRGDTHVVAAAILMKHLLATEGAPSDKVFIVSSNTKHLAVKDVAGLGIEVITPGAFIDMVTQADSTRMAQALDRTVSDLSTPPYTKSEILGALQLHGANATVAQMRQAWGVSLPGASKRKR